VLCPSTCPGHSSTAADGGPASSSSFRFLDGAAGRGETPPRFRPTAPSMLSVNRQDLWRRQPGAWPTCCRTRVCRRTVLALTAARLLATTPAAAPLAASGSRPFLFLAAENSGRAPRWSTVQGLGSPGSITPPELESLATHRVTLFVYLLVRVPAPARVLPRYWAHVCDAAALSCTLVPGTSALR